ncbi:MAG: ZIP family zinc transporter [Natronomonas sp.]|jgi:ZIP family zinc transporter|uniref:ZIP family metal transporter n=1 Tax=Natronomonas sp. TaxID=2184060 RepID=UPI0039E353EB
MAHSEFALVFIAGAVTMLATGLGALPFFFIETVSDRLNVALWGVASGIMVSASVFGLIFEAREYGGPVQIGAGLLVGAALVAVSRKLIHGYEFDPGRYESADSPTLVLVVGVLTVHSFPEGVAVGVSFAQLGLEGGVPLYGFSIPVLAVFMTVAISIHNIPEGIAVSIPLQSMGAGVPRMAWWAVFTSIPQPIGAVIAYGFVRLARDLLAFGFGFAAGAMLWLVIIELIPEGREAGAELPDNGNRVLIAGFIAGILIMLPLLFV